MDSKERLDGVFKMKYYNREIEDVVLKASETFPVILVTGPRQIGKTTLLKNLNDGKRKYVTLDNPIARKLANEDPGLFMQKYKPPVIIDEVQYAPNLFAYIKMYVDKEKTRGEIWLTGSQIFHLMKNVSETLAGRIAIINLLGFSQREIKQEFKKEPFVPDLVYLNKYENNNKIDLNILFERIFQGSLPHLILDKSISRDIFFLSYIQTYLQRDLRDLTNVGNEGDFLKFLEVVAARTAQILNLTDIAKDVGISLKTVKKWLSILETSGIVYLLKPYHNNLTKRLIKAPKVYFLDTGLCAYLCGWESSKTIESSMMSGAFMETYVVAEIIKSFYNSGKTPKIYYYRDKDKKEIDILINRDNVIYPVEIKKTANPNKKMISNFKVLDKYDLNIGNGSLVCLYQEVFPLDEKNNIVPVGMI